MLASKENAEDLRVLRDLIESAGITPAIDHVYLLSEVPAAIQYVSDGRAKGKVVITL
jgi:NADPH:quinone reductase-like Zn-dependent oxidoreductase